MATRIQPDPQTPASQEWRVAIVASTYQTDIMNALRQGATQRWAQAGGQPQQLDTYDAPGSFELPQIAAAIARTGAYDGIVALGCIIRGETRHDRYIAAAVAQGLTDAALETGIPIALGVITTNNLEQAQERAGGKHGNKGDQAMAALLATIATLDRIDDTLQSPADA